jgi:hypothetical protein
MLAMSDEQIPMVGGPKEGETYKWTTATTLVIPDSKEVIYKATADGGVTTIFGQHTYRLNYYRRDDLTWYRWDYVGYEPPK